MRELIYTGIFLFLAIVLIVLLILMFRSEKTPEKQTPISTERYTAGVYSSPVTLGDTVVDVTVTVDPNRIKAISLNHLSGSPDPGKTVHQRYHLGSHRKIHGLYSSACD